MSLITYVTRIHFADRVLEDALPDEMERLGLRRPIVVADTEAAGGDALGRLDDALPPEARPLVHLLTPGTTGPAAALAAAGLASGHAPDSVICLGGCRAIDAGRLLGLAGADPAALAALLSGRAGAGGPPRLPVVAVPTLPGQGLGLAPSLRLDAGPASGPASGLGSGPEEAGPDARTLTGPALVPDLVLIDPTLGREATPERIAASGMDALTHCIEAYLGTTWNPPADGIALDGVRRAARALERAVAAPHDIAARRELMAAGLNGGLAAQKGLGGVHALAHALESEAAAPPPHGALHGALFPQVLAFNAPAVADRFAPLAHAMGLAADADLPAALAALGARLALPASLSTLGLDAAALARVARRAEAEAANRTNPRLATAEDYARLLAAAG